MVSILFLPQALILEGHFKPRVTLKRSKGLTKPSAQHRKSIKQVVINLCLQLTFCFRQAFLEEICSFLNSNEGEMMLFNFTLAMTRI